MNKKEAIDAAEIGNMEWLDRAEPVALAQIKHWKKYGAKVTTADEIWGSVVDLGPPKEPRAMGALMRRLQKAGAIHPLGRWVPSMRAACHSRPVRVWRICNEH